MFTHVHTSSLHFTLHTADYDEPGLLIIGIKPKFITSCKSQLGPNFNVHFDPFYQKSDLTHPRSLHTASSWSSMNEPGPLIIVIWSKFITSSRNQVGTRFSMSVRSSWQKNIMCHFTPRVKVSYGYVWTRSSKNYKNKTINKNFISDSSLNKI